MSDLRYSLVLLGLPLVRRIASDGRETELVWRLRRALQMVAFLALQPDRRSHRDDLVEAIWPEASAEAIRKNFHPTLADARRTLDPDRRRAIVFRHGVYLLHPEGEWLLDVEELRCRVSAGKKLRETEPLAALETLTAAWRLHRGPFLAGLDAPWISNWREELRRDYIALLREIGSLSDELGKVTEAVDAYRAVLLEEPYEEHVYIKLMELYARQGRRDLVRKQYVFLQERLKELAVEPLEQSQNCYHRLMR